MSTRLFIVRHAEHVKPGDDHLSKVGSLQAAALAETFKSSKTKYDAVYASSRCRETAEAIASALGLTVTIDERLRNWDGGVIKGLTKDEVKEKHPEVFQSRYVRRDPHYVVPEGESLQQRFDRVASFLHDVVATGPSPSLEPRQIIIVTHGGVIDDTFRIACKLPLPERTGLKKPFGCVSALLHENGNWRDEHQWARADHLPRVVAVSPTGGHLYLFPNQVSGSFPMLRGDRGELCKPATANELSCYHAIFANPPISPELERLKECVPKFLGTVDVDIATILHENPPASPSSAGTFAGSPRAPPANSTFIDSPASPNYTNKHALQTSEQKKPETEEDKMEALSLNSSSGFVESGSPGGAPGTSVQSHFGEMRRTSTASSIHNPEINPRRSFSVSNLWTRFVNDRWQKLVRPDDNSKRCVYLILENVTHGLVNPNIMDVKVGTRQHRDTETEAKQKRKELRCKESTSATLGLRIHGVSMYSNSLRKMVLRDKYWGRSLDDAGVFKAFQEFIDCAVADPRYVVDRIVQRLGQISECIRGVTWRFWGSSILIVFDSQVEQPVVHVRLIDLGSCDMNTEGKYQGADDGFIFGLANLMRGFQKALDVMEGRLVVSSNDVLATVFSHSAVVTSATTEMKQGEDSPSSPTVVVDTSTTTT